MAAIKTKEDVKKFVKDKDVSFIRLWFTDILGQVKSFAITANELDNALSSGMGFDGSSITGFQDIEESDMIAMPDPSTFQILPWRPQDKPVGRMICDIKQPSGDPYEGDPRYVLKRALTRMEKMGYDHYYVGPELEFFYFKDSKSTEPLDRGGYFDLTDLDVASDLRRDTVLALEAMGIVIEYSHHEVAPSQHEIDMRYCDALQMADNVITYRVIVKEIARKHGVYATFMPKPIFGENGSGMHVHQSLFKGKKNAFFGPKEKYNLTDDAKRFIAGQLRHAPEMISVFAQWINSYKRLVPGYEAPVYLSWAKRNRSDMIRVPEYRPGKEKATRIELRSPDPACNPYLCFSVMLAAGLKGIEEGLEPPEPVEENVYEMSEKERRNRGIFTLPGSLEEALALTEKSKLVREALGDHVFNAFIENKKIEWNQYRIHVSKYEIDRYLPML